MPKQFFPPWPSYEPDEVEAVARVVASNRVNYWTGTEGQEFEREFAEWAGTRHAVALHNGSIALEAPLRALRLGPEDEVVVTPRSFIASASCVILAGSRPVFADVDRDSGNLTAETIERVLTPRTRAIVVVHLGGWPCEMDPIMSLARSRGIRVIEDCAQAHGASYRGRRVGAIGDAGSWSFCQDKIITTGGEGGMVTTDDAEIWERSWSFKDHGKGWDATHAPNPGGSFRWVHESFGTNGRMLEISAAVGRIQLKKLPAWTARRREIAATILEAAGRSAALRAPQVPAWSEHANYRAYAYVEPAALREGWDRDRISAELVSRKVPCYSGSCPEIYLERAFEGTGFAPPERLPVARALGETSLMFLAHPTIGAGDVARTCDAIADVMALATR